MKISPTILNSSSALGLGSVSQCALGGQGRGPVSDGGRDPQERTPRGELSGEGIRGPGDSNGRDGMEFSRVSWPFNDLKIVTIL